MSGWTSANASSAAGIESTGTKALEEDVEATAHEPEGEDLTHLRARQAAGEIADELDPAFVLLLLRSAVVSGVVFPGDVKRLMSLDPSSPEYLDHMGRQLPLLVARLA
ncbi:MAG: hypothetical protein H0V22_02045 [Solirubrobacterales bacterium]|nr:hypothetical protein [Solirubrobacterales bacterium]